MESHTEKGLQEALRHIAKGNPCTAVKIIGKLFEEDLSCHELAFTTRCCTFWIGIIKQVSEIDSPFEKGEKLLSEWKNYIDFISDEQNQYVPTLYATQRGVFSLALENYSKLLEDKDISLRATAFWKAGVCYKKLGQFETAQKFLHEASAVLENNATILAELADCFCLCGDDNHGKLIFREAFFLDPIKVDLDFLDSELIRCLIDKTAERGFSGMLLQLWVPVYGAIWGIFNVKRGLSTHELAKLKEDMYAIENDMKEPGAEISFLTPRLINLYFWLIDYYVQTNDSAKKINDLLLKIKIIDKNVYDLYAK